MTNRTFRPLSVRALTPPHRLRHAIDGLKVGPARCADRDWPPMYPALLRVVAARGDGTDVR